MNKLEYNLPKITSEDAASKAVECLAEVEALGGEYLSYCIQATNVLVFAGLRAVSPHISIEESFTEEKIQKLNDILVKYNCAVLLQNEYGSDLVDRDVAFINTEVLQNITQQYPFMEGALRAPEDANWCHYREWTRRIWIHLANKIGDNELPKVWLTDWFAPHTLHFGMVLGNPGIALTSACERAIGSPDRQKNMELVSIEVEGSSVFQNVSLNYAVDENLVNDQEVLGHSALWQGTLKTVYHHFTDQKLERIDGFNIEIASR